MSGTDYTYPLTARLLHMGMAVLGIAAYLTAEGAEDGYESTAYLLHAWLGLSLAGFLAARLICGFAGPETLRFSGWSPLSGKQWRLALADLGCLIRFRVPQRGLHEGLAGITQALGILLFAWMGFTGTWMYLLGGGPESDLFEAIEEAHEVGETLIPLYLLLHVGSVVVHSLAGHPIWQRMWSLRKDAPTVPQRD